VGGERTVWERLQEEIQEIYDVLRREQPERSTIDLWSEALTLHRVRYETEVLPPPRNELNGVDVRRYHP
jgi:hypothetical protein